MRRRFVIEAVMVATYGQLLVPSQPVDFVLPYSTIMELYDMLEIGEQILENPDDDAHAKQKIAEMIAFFEDPFNRKKIERTLQAPWRESAPLLLNDKIQFTVVYAVDNAEYGDIFDPIETELLLTSLKLEAPMLTDQYEFQDRLIEAEVPVQIYDIEDYEFAVEDGLTSEEWRALRDC